MIPARPDSTAPRAPRRVLVLLAGPGEPDELLRALVERSRHEPLELTLLVTEEGSGTPHPQAEDGAPTRRLRAALARFRAAGLYVREAVAADADPIRAATAAAESLDEIVLAAPPGEGADRPLDERLRAATAVEVIAVPGGRRPL